VYGVDSRADQGSEDRCQGESSSEFHFIPSQSLSASPSNLGTVELLDYFRGVVESIKDGLFVLDEQGRFEYANPMGLTVFKWPRQEVLGHHFLKLVSPDCYLQAMKAWQDVVAGNQGTVELEVILGDGGRRHLLVGYCPLKYRDSRKYCVSFLDIGPLKSLEHQLRRSQEQVEALYRQQNDYLHQIEHQYYGLLENAGYIAIILDEEGVYVYGNPVAEQYLGLKQGQLAGRHICDVFGTEQGQQRLAMIPQILAGQVTHFEDKLTIDGRELYFDIHCWPLHTDSGQKRRILLFAADITESKKTQEALHRSEELFRTIFNSSNDCIVIWDRNYQFIDANTSAVAFMRRERSQVVGHRLDEMLGWNPEYLAQWKGRIDRVFQTGQPERVEDRLFYEDQEHYSESVLFPLRNHQDAVFAVGAVYRDVTDNRKAVRALAESEHRFRSLADAAFEGIVIHDHGMIVDCNQRYAEMAGCSREELIGKNVMELIHPEDCNKILGVKQPDYPHLYTARMICGDGSIRTVEYQGRSIQWGCRQLRVASARDITERQKMEQELAQTRQRLQELHRQMYLGSMSAFLAHELNQPLTVMELTLSEALQHCNDTDSGQAMRAIIENNLRQIQRATDTIQKFRRFFKMASFDTEQIISIEPVVQRVKMSLLELARQARIEIVLDPSLKDLPDLIFSDLAMEQICMVLMQNAVDAADPNLPNRLVISGRVADHGVELSFADDSGGVPQAVNEPFSEPFFTTKAGSLGLGLEIVRRILSACGGSIRLDNDQGKGCCFVIRIPFNAS